MKSFLEKFIASIVIFSLCLGMCFDIIVFKPKTAQALDGGAGFLNNIKEMVLDSVANIVSNVVYKRLEQSIYNWGTGKTSSIRLPFGIEDFNDYFDEFIDVASSKFLQDLKDTMLCKGISVQFGKPVSFYLQNINRTIKTNSAYARFPATFGTAYSDRPSYQKTAACTLDRVIANVESFIKNPKISIYGWDAWKALNSPQNNVFGAFFTALDAKTQQMVAAQTNAQMQATTSGGYRNQTTTTANTKDTCAAACNRGTGLDTCGKPTSASTCDAQYPNVGPLEPEQYALYQQCLQREQQSGQITGFDTPSCQQDIQACVANCSRIPFKPLATAVSNLGSSIHESMDKALGADLSRIINVSEITQLAGIFFQALFNKAMNGLGLAAGAMRQSTSTAQKARQTAQEKYSYLNQFAKANGAVSAKQARTNVVSTLDSSMKSYNRSVIACDSKAMMSDTDWAKNVIDIMEPQTENLYTGITGTALQPDWVVLDPPYAPYSVYGYSWGEVYPSKVPPQCRAILTQLNMPKNSTCSNIISGLEPNYGLTTATTTNNNTGIYGAKGDPCIFEPNLPQCTRVPYALDVIPGIGPNGANMNSPCIPCMYDHDALSCPAGLVPPQRYPGNGIELWTDAVLQPKLDIYNNCNSQYTTVIKRCDACMKKYDQTCANMTTSEEKNNCIQLYCGGPENNPDAVYEDIVNIVIDPPTSGLDFYGKCLIEEQKSACLSCLKEYYIPSTYCQQVEDYTARMIIKYPAIVVNKYRKDEGEFRGIVDESIYNQGDLCNDNDGAEHINIALICRILPDFSYQGTKICEQWCNHNSMTTTQLEDVTDFRPNNADCINPTEQDQRYIHDLPPFNADTHTGVGGKMPFQYLESGILDARTKCCATLWQKNSKNYATCVGAGATTDEGTPITNPLSLTLSASPATGLAPLNAILRAVVAGNSSGQNLTFTLDCDTSDSITSDATMDSTNTTVNFPAVCNYTENNHTYTAHVTAMGIYGTMAEATTEIHTTDCTISTTTTPTPAIIPVNVNITAGIANGTAPSYTYRFYCNAPGTDTTAWTNASIEYSSNTNSYTLDNACNFTTAQTANVGVIITPSQGSTSSCTRTVNILPQPAIDCTMNADARRTGSLGGGDLEVTIDLNGNPNTGFTALAGSSPSITFEYDCNNDGQYEITSTQNDYNDTTAGCANYLDVPGMTYTIRGRVGTSGLGAYGDVYGTCQAQVYIPELRIQ